MMRTWSRPLPLEMICPDCHGKLPKGILWHTCNGKIAYQSDTPASTEAGDQRLIRARIAARLATTVAENAKKHWPQLVTKGT